MKFDAGAAIIALVALAVSAAFYPGLPPQIPIRWGPSGVEAWGSKIVVFALPVLALALNLVESSKRGRSAKGSRTRVRIIAVLFSLLQALMMYALFSKLA